MSKIIYFIVFIILSVVGCVSVTLKTEPPKRADVQYQDLPTAFEKKSKTNQPTWLHKNLGLYIAIYSECRNQDISFDDLRGDALAALDSVSNVKEEKTSVSLSPEDKRDAVRVTAEGKVNGVNSQMTALLFKKDKCTFTVSYGGKAAHFNSQLDVFNKFAASVRVP